MMVFGDDNPVNDTEKEMDLKVTMSKEDMIKYLKCFDYELDKLLNKRKISHSVKFDIYLFGGISVLLSTESRRLSGDIDVFMLEDSCLKDAIKIVARRFNLQDDWMNTDVQRSPSFSIDLLKYCVRTLKEIIWKRCYFYTPPDDLLLCMKLIAFRQRPDKNDVNDIYTLIEKYESIGITVNSAYIYKCLDLYYEKYNLLAEAKDFIDGR